MSDVKLDKIAQNKTLSGLVSVGKATLKDFEILGIQTIYSLAEQDPRKLYLKLCKLTGKQHDICIQDVFSAAIAQSKDPNLPIEKCNWWYWSRVRKGKNDTNK